MTKLAGARSHLVGAALRCAVALALAGCASAPAQTATPSAGGPSAPLSPQPAASAAATQAPTSPTPATPSATAVPPSSAPVSASPSGNPAPSATTSPAAATPTAAPNVDPAAVAAARQVIEAADPADPAKLDELSATVRFSAEGEAAARAILADPGADTTAVWAAVWVYGSTAVDPAPLRPFAAHADPSIRAMAGAALLALGDPAGFVALVDSLAVEAQLRGAHPARTVRSFALGTLFA